MVDENFVPSNLVNLADHDVTNRTAVLVIDILLFNLSDSLVQVLFRAENKSPTEGL